MDKDQINMEALLDKLSAVNGTPLNNMDISSFVYCLVITLVFGIILATLYRIYYQENEPQDTSLARSLVLLTPSLMCIFWIVQHSVTLSLGVLGALSFVRFRTPVKRSEDVAFIVIALATAIACSIQHYLLPTALLGIFFVFSFARGFFNKWFVNGERFAIVTFNTNKIANVMEVRGLLATVCKRPEFISSRTYDGITSFVFNIPDLNSRGHEVLTTTLATFDKQSHISVFFPNERIGA